MDKRGKSFRVGDNGLYPARAFRGGDVYILDDVDPDAEQEEIMGRPVLDVHASKCGYVRDLFTQHSVYNVHSVRFPAGTTRKQFWEYWEHELRSKQVGDLVIVYFHGKAGNEETNYTWSLTEAPRKQINAWRFINMFNESKAHSLFLLDCYIHDRITAKWKLQNGNTEIISRKENMVGPDGRAKKHTRDFTEAMVINMLEFTRGRRGRFRNRKAMITIPNIMAKDKQMYSNVQRIWLDRSRAGVKKVVQRFKLNPLHVRVTGRLEFFAVQLRGTPVKPLDNGLDGDDDEGFVDMDEDDEESDDNDSDPDDNDGEGGGSARRSSDRVDSVEEDDNLFVRD